jgi:uncharacterized protein (DUF362 family)
MHRRKFIKYSLNIGGAAVFIPGQYKMRAAVNSVPDVVWVEGGEPKQLVSAAFQAFQGIERFISKGDVVVIKPNMGWDRAPQFAANTNPECVAAVVEACYEAGAKSVKLFDRTCNNALRCYKTSQIEKYASQVDAEVSHVRDNKFKTVALKQGEILKEWSIYEDYLNADKIINIPIAKHHSLCKATLGLKNLMGVMGGERGEIHNKFEIKLIDITSNILPTLTIIDAYRILMRNGPVGGNLNDVKLTKALIMSPCTVTADKIGLELFGHQLEDVAYLKTAYSRKINRYEPDKLNLEKIKLG